MRKIEFMGVPILYLPWVSFPLGDRAQERLPVFRLIGNYLAQRPAARGAVLLEHRAEHGLHRPADRVQPARHRPRRRPPLPRPRAARRADWHYLPDDSVFGGSRSDVRLHRRRGAAGQPALHRRRRERQRPALLPGLLAGPGRHQHRLRRAPRPLSYRNEHWRIDGEAQQYQTIDYTLVAARPALRTRAAHRGDADYGWGPGSLLHYGFDSESRISVGFPALRRDPDTVDSDRLAHGPHAARCR